MSSNGRRVGFTLVELLTVIALITVLAGVFSFAVLRMGSGSLEGAERLAGSQFAAARNQALLKSSPVRVLIHNNPEDPERYLREIGIITNTAGPGVSPEWTALSQGERLPAGYFFVPGVSLADGTREPEVMQVEFPSVEPVAEGQGEAYYYFEYTAQGLANPGGAQFVLEPGRLEPDGGGFQVVPQESNADLRKEKWGGFLILRLGGVLYFPDSESIKGE
jgi:prepilin-type N-terminal cleavage/methylation domain-containing protein